MWSDAGGVEINLIFASTIALLSPVVAAERGMLFYIWLH